MNFRISPSLVIMKKIAVASGKGGVGKSMLCSALAMLFAKDKKKITAVDCDVDAPNLAVWLGEPEKWKEIKKISVSEKPVIDSSKLTKKQAEQCLKKCRFNALKVEKGKLKLNPFLCEGCGACEVFCPPGVIKMKPVKNGEIRTKKIYPHTKRGQPAEGGKIGKASPRSGVGAGYDFPLVSGQLYPGETGSGKVVTEIKQQAEKFEGELMLIDSAPGTGCPVIASLQDANFALLITEPTPSGLSDLKRVLKVVEHFGIPWSLVINKWDINKKLFIQMKNWVGKKFLGKISYDKNIFKAVSNLCPIMETNLEAKKEIEDIYFSLCPVLESI